MLKTQAQIIFGYSQHIEQVTATIENTKKRIENFSYLRIALFFVEVALFVLLLNSADDIGRTIIQIGLVIPIVVFAFVVKKQSKLDNEISYQKQLLWVYQNEWNLLNGIKNGYDDGAEYESEIHPYTSDLDIFGKASLYALINRCYTKKGKALLAKNLKESVQASFIISRQEAVKEVLTCIDDTFDFRANLHGFDAEKIERIKAQLDKELAAQLEFIRNGALKIYVKIAPFISFGILAAAIFFGGIFWNLLTVYLLANIAFVVSKGSKINKVYYSFSGGSNLLNGYAKAISWTEKHSWNTVYIQSLFASDKPVSEEIKKLSKIIQEFDARLNIVVSTALNAFLLWDLKCCIKLNEWHQNSSKDVVAALNQLGDFEELIALATLAYNQPEWVFPKIKNDFTLQAEEIGHPLIPENIRVRNNFNIENIPTVDVVTGSNMAGKSTFLRTVGINAVLAYTGAPVCAKEMNLSVFKLNTFMRIKDSLNESTSTFKAELNRLKMILDNVSKSRDTFVLIDEMLRGTNSRDKYLGSKVFIEKLIAEETPALFATHDLQLADMINEHPKTLRNFHFDIQIQDGEMKFDYKLKQGPCSTFNAAILLKEIGLSLE
ncbi:DNA mismatch repair protein MutS [Pedobacter sp. Leaf132]|uniref:MutS-related protein n=1 Tax=Pedobacter sp. Leaf132 TaxID=2876557 RepID=UPI001E471425|nr:DNA mismatch repair protein MutS [Pedobacter sp. Leaf132]